MGGLRDGVVGTDIKDLGNDPEAYRWVYLKNNHVARDNYAPMMNLAKTMSMTGTALRTNLPNVMDIDEWTRAVAFISWITVSLTPLSRRWFSSAALR